MLLPKRIVCPYSAPWQNDDTWQHMTDALRTDVRSVKTPEHGGMRSYDGGKKINRRRLHVGIDTVGPLFRMSRIAPSP